MILAGRGFGKSRSGAEYVRKRVQSGQARRIVLAGPTAGDVRDIMIEGESGLIAALLTRGYSKREISLLVQCSPITITRIHERQTTNVEGHIVDRLSLVMDATADLTIDPERKIRGRHHPDFTQAMTRCADEVSRHRTIRGRYANQEERTAA